MGSSDLSFDTTVVSRVLAGGGEMGRLTRAYDWSRSSIGSVASWPQSLRTTVSIILNSTFPMFLWWGDELIQFYNDAYRPSLGNAGKHPLALGQRGEDCWPEIWPLIKPLIDQVLQRGESVWMEDQLIPIYRNNRLEDVYWTFSYSPVMGETGAICGVLVVCSETTEKVRTIRKLQASDQRFKNLVRDANVGIVVLEGEEVIVNIVNEAYGQLIDRTPAELLGKRLFDVIPDAEDPYRKLLDNVRLTGNPLHLYATPYLIYADGKKIEGFLDVIYQPYKEADGSITGVMALVHNVTDRTLSRRKIEEAELKTRLAIESAEQGTYEIDLETDEMITSERFNAIWGMEDSFSRAKIASYIHPEDRAMRDAAHQDSLKTGNLHYEARIIWNDGSLHWVRVKGKVIYDEGGKARTLLGIIQDITEQKLFADHLSRLVDDRTLELQRSNEDLLQFAHVISHDLKEPVRKIRLFANRIQEEIDGMPEKGLLFLHKIEHAAGRIYTMIEGVLSYSSVQTSEQLIEPVDLDQLMKNIESDLEVVIHQKNARIDVVALPVIEGSAILIYQLFYNLINNALKFSGKVRRPIVSVSYSTVHADGRDMARIVISDNGIGFEQENAEKIFNSFSRLNSKDKFEGTGLGLALCKKIAIRHGGSIDGRGIPDEGAVFTVLLPFQQIRKTF